MMSELPPWLALAFVFGFGLLWGSFFNVCILRLPVGESVVRHGSRCPKCAKQIRWYQNIPLLSYFALRGKCANCKLPISWQYPVIELVTGILFLAAALHFGLTRQFVGYTVLLSALLVVSVIDLHHRIIPDEISLPGILLGFAASFWLGEISWVESLVGILVGGGSFFAIAYGYEKIAGREGLGGGDVKLLAMIGAWLGYKNVFIVILLSSLLGSLVGIAVMLIQRRDMKTAIPFGPFLSVSAAFCIFAGHLLTDLLFPEA